MHHGCTTLSSFGVTGGTRMFCVRHAEKGMVNLGRSGGAQECGVTAVDQGTARRAGAGGKWTGCLSSSTQTETSICGSGQ